MIVSTILLSLDDCYIDNHGNLPSERPNFDKKLLKAIVNGQTVTHKAFNMLPNSIRKDLVVTDENPSVGVTISEISALSDMIVVVRTQECLNSPFKFRFTNFECLVKDTKIEIWMKK